MGLDMYLSAEVYFYHNIYQYDELKKDFFNRMFLSVLKKTNIPHEGFEEFDVESLSFRIGYWRKAYAIHDWFVENVQDGADDCKSYDVSREQLCELRKLCQQALESDEPQRILPANDEDWNGGYGEYYDKYLKETIEMIDAALQLPSHIYFQYISSW